MNTETRIESANQQRVDHVPDAAVSVTHAEVQRRTARLVHELRNPLFGILGAASLMRYADVGPGRPDPDRLLDIIETSGKHMMRLVSEMMDVALGQQAQLPVQPTRTELRRVLREALEIVEPLAANKGLSLVLDVAPTIPATAVFDPLRVQQVLVNLLGNAIRFTDEGVVELLVDEAHAIDPSTGSPAQALRLTVRDTGVGMAESELLCLLTSLLGDVEHAPLGPIRRGGSGLGLLVCESILRTMNSKLNVHSTPGRGTRVWFVLNA